MHLNSCQLTKACHPWTICSRLRSTPCVWLSWWLEMRFSGFTCRSRWRFAWSRRNVQTWLCTGCRRSEGLFRTFLADSQWLDATCLWRNYVTNKIPHEHENILLEIDLRGAINKRQQGHNSRLNWLYHNRYKLRILTNLPNNIPQLIDQDLLLIRFLNLHPNQESQLIYHLNKLLLA